MEEYKKIEELIRKKIEKLKNADVVDDEELQKFTLLHRLISNKYEFLFEKLNMDVAIAILRDVGIPEEELLHEYQSLIKEEMKQKYILLDIDIENDER